MSAHMNQVTSRKTVDVIIRVWEYSGRFSIPGVAAKTGLCAYSKMPISRVCVVRFTRLMRLLTSASHEHFKINNFKRVMAVERVTYPEKPLIHAKSRVQKQ